LVAVFYTVKYQRLRPEDIQHVLIHKFSVKVKLILCVRHESIVETGGTAPFILIFTPVGASGQLHSLAVLPHETQRTATLLHTSLWMIHYKRTASKIHSSKVIIQNEG
jgi:hypothetical protein